MKKILPLVLLAFVAFSCDKEDDNPPTPEDRETMLAEKIFNGKSKWLITKMDADVERTFDNNTSKNWLSLLSDCRTDNIYQFSELAGKYATIDADEGTKVCTSEEQNFISDAVFMTFSSDYSKSEVEIQGETMQKMFGIPYTYNLEFADFTHTWEFQEITESKIVVKSMIPADQSADMVDQAATVTIVFERTN